MAYNSLSIAGQTPYQVYNNGNFVKRKNEEDKEPSDSSRPENSDTQENQSNLNYQTPKKNVYQRLNDSKQNEKKAITARDATLKNATVNIAQIIKDFKNTAKAIGSPPELCEEVEIYLTLVEKHVTKENTPDVKLIRSNLVNASSLLDKYISETLERPSKVVENWINALFLQQINYKFNDEEVNANFLVKFPNGKKEKDEDKNEENESENEDENDKSSKNFSIPQDENLKNLFLKAKKYSYAKDYKKAMDFFKEALDRAIEVEDKETESKVLFEIGSIYDKNDYLAQALTSYNRSLNTTSDVSVKTKAHYSMAQIYDDVAQFESAINHYMTSISYAGETENLTAQSTSLVKIGKIYADEYNKEALEFLSVAENLADESKKPVTKGYVCGNIANVYNKFNEPHHALKYYSNAIKDYEEAHAPIKVAINYKRAAELMKDYKNTNKAKKLMQKALLNARQTDDVQLMKDIHEALSTF